MSDHRATSSSRMGFTWLWSVVLLGVGARGAASAEPGRSPSQLLPAPGLTSYLEYDGLDAHRDAWRASAAHEILVGKSAGSTMADVERRALDRLLKVAFGHSKLTGADFLAFQDHIVGHGFAFASYEDDGESSTAFVLGGFGDKGGLNRFESMVRCLLRMGANVEFPAPTRVRNRDLHGFGQRDDNRAEAPAAPGPDLFGRAATNPPPAGLTWWPEGDALILVKGPTADPLDALRHPGRANKDLRALHKARVSSVLDAIETGRLNVAGHPAYVASMAEGRDLKGFEPSGLFFADGKDGHGVLERMGEWLRHPRAGAGVDEFTFFEVMDLNRATRIVGRWGFRGKSLVTDVRFEAPDAWKGPLRRGGFSRDRLPPIPKGMGTFAIGSLDRGRTVERLAPLGAAVIPEALVVITALDRTVRETTTARQREDFLRHLGPTWCVYASPGRNGSTVPTFLVEFDDVEGLDKALGAIVSGINAGLRARLGGPADAKPAAIAIERLPMPERGYRLVSSGGLLPWMTDGLQPTILIGKSYLAVAASPALARAAIAAESNRQGRWEPTDELAKTFESLPANLSFLSVGNPRDSTWPEAIANFRGTAGSFLARFVGMDMESDPPANRPPDLLDALGVPKNAADSPRADELRALIHPSVLAATVDDRSLRIISLEALPLACLWIEARSRPGAGMQPLSIEVKFSPGR